MRPDGDVLRTSPLLVGLAGEELEALVNAAEFRRFAAGERIVEEDTPSDCLFILLKGSVQVEKGPAEDPVVLTVLQEQGDFFGEMSLIDIQPRSAHIRAREDVDILAFSKKVLTSLFTRFPRVQMTIILNIARRLSLRLREANTRIVELSRAADPGTGG